MIPQQAYLRKIVYAFIFFSLTGVVLVALYLNAKLTSSAIEQWGFRHQSTAHSIAERIEENLLSGKSRLMEVANNPVFSSLSHLDEIDLKINGIPENLEQDKRNLMADLLGGENGFSVTFVLRPNGDHYISHPFKVQKNLKKYNLAERPYFQEASRTRKPVISDSIMGADGVPAVVIDIPLLNTEKQIYAHLGGVLHLRRLHTLTESALEPPFDEWILLSKRNQLIAAWTEDEDEIQELKDLSKELNLQKNPAHNGLALAKDAGFQTLLKNNTEYVINTTTLKSGWRFILMRDIASIEKSVRPEVIKTTLIIAFVFCTLSAVGIAIAGQIGRRWQAAEENLLNANQTLGRLVESQNLNIKQGEQLYHSLLDSVEVSIWEEDFTDVFLEIELLREKGIVNIREYFSENLDHAWRLAAAVKISNINSKTVELFGAPNKEALMGSIDQIFSETSIYRFVDELVAFWNKDKTFRSESVRRRLDGSEIIIIVSMPIPQTLEEAKRVPVSLLDVTELKSNEQKMARANRALTLLSECSTTVNHATNEKDLMNDVCAKIARRGSYPLVWVGLKENDGDKKIAPVAMAGPSIEYLTDINVSWGDNKWGNGPIGRSIKDECFQIVGHLQEEQHFSPWAKRAEQFSLRSCIALPLKLESGEVLGALALYSEEQNAFDLEETGLLVTLAETLAFGIWDIRMEAAQKEAENKLRDSEARFRSITNSSSIAMVLATDDEGFVISWNPAAEKAFGYSEEEIKGLHLTKLMPARYRQAHNKGFERAIKNKNYKIIGKTVELAGLKKDGTEFPIELSLGKWEEKGATYFSGVIHDISERKAMEKNLVAAQKMESVGQLSGGIAHDFNNLLGIIQGNLELIASFAKDQEKISKRVEPAMRATQRGAELTKRLLGFSRRKAQDPKAVNLNTLIMRSSPLLEKSLTSLVKISYDLADDLWPTELDPGDFEDALINLSINARDAMKGNGTLKFKTQNVPINARMANLVPFADPIEYVKVSITDSGSGMSPEVQARIFEPFFSTKEESKGTGLGLSMVYGFIKRSNGFIDVQSAPDEGTTFHIFLPKSASLTQGRNLDDAGELDKIPTGSETILVVDDEEDLLDTTVAELKELGYKVLCTTNAKQAFEIINQGRHIDLLISDVVMPGGWDGFDLSAQVFRNHPEVRILLISGYTAKLEEKRKRKDPVLDYLLDNILAKPFSHKELSQRVRETLDSTLTIPWKPEYSTKIEEIDQDHLVLITLLNKLLSGIENDKGSEEINRIIEGIADYTEFHFMREEAIMAVCDYPHLDNHRKVHRMMAEKVRNLTLQEKDEHDPKFLGELVEYLLSWLIDHIQGMDMGIQPFAAGKSKEISLALKKLTGPNNA